MRRSVQPIVQSEPHSAGEQLLSSARLLTKITPFHGRVAIRLQRERGRSREAEETRQVIRCNYPYRVDEKVAAVRLQCGLEIASVSSDVWPVVAIATLAITLAE